ncbi:MAG TPA: 30S ribosome-binding factor RbfA [Opitutaceae bacterium]|nr:30S ribosome-binding factor RbfA [Opitutaceae bacterium]
MSNRIVRINELVQREINDILRRRHTAEAISITVSEVRVAPDLRDGRVFVAILGDEADVAERFRWLKRKSTEIRGELARRIVLKFIPHLTYVLDKSSDRAARVIHALDRIGPAGEPPTETGHGEILS